MWFRVHSAQCRVQGSPFPPACPPPSQWLTSPSSHAASSDAPLPLTATRRNTGECGQCSAGGRPRLQLLEGEQLRLRARVRAPPAPAAPRATGWAAVLCANVRCREWLLASGPAAPLLRPAAHSRAARSHRPRTRRDSAASRWPWPHDSPLPPSIRCPAALTWGAACPAVLVLAGPRGAGRHRGRLRPGLSAARLLLTRRCLLRCRRARRRCACRRCLSAPRPLRPRSWIMTPGGGCGWECTPGRGRMPGMRSKLWRES